MQDGHFCPSLLNLIFDPGLRLRGDGFEDTKSESEGHEAKVKSGGQECPPHTAGATINFGTYYPLSDRRLPGAYRVQS
jgi:hypothetical protein